MTRLVGTRTPLTVSETRPSVMMQEESSLEMEELGIQDAKINDRVIHKAKRPSKSLPKVGSAYKLVPRTQLTLISPIDLL